MNDTNNGREQTAMPDVAIDLESMGRAAQAAGRVLATLNTNDKNGALHAIADALEAQTDAILAENSADIAAGRAKGLSTAILDRLLLTPRRIQRLADDARQVATLPDPVGEDVLSRVLPNGLRLSKRRIPIGVLGVIYEARPNVTVDIGVLSVKTGNAVIMRGGSETLRSNRMLAHVIRSALTACGLPADAIQYIDDPDRALVRDLLRLDAYVDMIIPRGGHALHTLCRNEATVPVITGGIGICHVFVDESADFNAALDIIENAKIQRPSVCNALDTVLVHSNVAGAFLPQMAARLAPHGVEIRAAGPAFDMLDGGSHGATVLSAGPDDFDTEWMALILGVRIVPTLGDAIAHIQQHSMDHSDSIVTNDWRNATQFVDQVNSSAVFVNASTRFNDGGQFGLGAEVAISTQKLHARGPMGLEELTTTKWVCIGDGHTRA